MTNLKKMMAAVTAAMCMAAMMPVSAIAEETESTIPVTEFVVTGVGDNSLILMFSGDTYTYSFSISNITSCNETPEYGDIIEIEGYWEVTELGWATNYMAVYFDLMGEEAGCNVTVTGSVFEAGREALYTITEIDEMLGYVMQDINGELVSYENDYLTSPEVQPGGYRWEYAEVGDEVMMLVYGGVPCIPQTVDTCQMAVIAENAEGDFIMMDVTSTTSNTPPTYYLTNELIAQHYVSDEEIRYGDIIEFPIEYFYYSVLEGTNECGFVPENEKIWKIGSLYEDGTREDVCVSFPYQHGWADLSLDDRTYSLFLYNVTQGGYTQPDGVDWTAFAEGDTLNMYTYNGIPCIPAAASLADVEISGQAMVIVGVDDAENPQNYVMMSVKNAKNLAFTYYLPAEAVQAHLTEGTIAYGDILDITGGLVVSTEDGTSSCTLAAEGEIRIAGSVFDYGTAETYTMSGRETGYTSAWVMENADGGEFLSYMDFVESGEYVQPDVQLPECKAGDEVVMYTYGGIPTIPVSVSPLGDVNLDSTLDILDVIALNKSLLAGAELPALSGAGSGDFGQCDFNGNGTLDMDDSLGMMKRILNIES